VLIDVCPNGDLPDVEQVMIRHVCLFSCVPEATSEQVAWLRREMAALADVIDGVISIEVQADIELREGNAQSIVISDFEDADAFYAYLVHPLHTQLAASSADLVATRSTIQYSVV
jgi:heme-degrading monooxygenase HmoA